MSKLRFKKQYSPSTRTVALFRGSFVIAVVGLLFQFLAIFMLPEGTLTFQAGPVSMLFFVVAFCVVLLLLCANVTLWFGMLHFLASYDGRAFGQKFFWAVITFFGLSVGAALYYWFVYRKYVSSIPLGQPKIQPV